MKRFDVREVSVEEIVRETFREWVEGLYSVAVLEGKEVLIYRTERLPKEEKILYYLSPNWRANDSYEICTDLLDEEECERLRELEAEGYDFWEALEVSEEYDRILSMLREVCDESL